MIDATPTLWDKPGYEALGWTFVELPGFSDWRDRHFESDSEFRLFQLFLAQSPDGGAVIPGCAGLRKIRWRDPRRGKGKRGGLRVVYLLIPEIRVMALVWVYGKDVAEDLTPAQKHAAEKYMVVIKQGLLEQHKRRGH